jgi:hypothetical protein
MSTWLGRMLGAAGCLFVLIGTATAAPPSAAQLAALVRALDVDDFSAREAASRQLIAAGDVAIDALAAGVTSDSPETAWRASLALEQVALSGSDATLERVAAVLQRLSQSGKPGLAAMTTELYAKQAKLRRDRAMAKVRALGGKFGGEEAEGSLVEVGLIFGDVVPRIIVQPEEEAKLGIEIPEEPPAIEKLAQVAEVPAAAEPPKEKIVGPAPPPDEPPPVVEDRDGLDAAIAEAFVADVIQVEIGPLLSDEGVGQESLLLDKQWRGGDAGVTSLQGVPRLVSLSIDHAPLTDAALDHVAGLAELAELDVRGTPFTSAGLYKFRERRPATRVYAIGTAMLGINASHHGRCELTGVYQGSGAFEAGLKPADEIVAVEGRPIRDFGDLTIAVYARRPGDKLKVAFRRDGRQHTVEVVLKERKELEPR